MVYGTLLCKKCANSSFAHLENQLRDSAGDVIDVADLPADVGSQPPEIVPLS